MERQQLTPRMVASLAGGAARLVLWRRGASGRGPDVEERRGASGREGREVLARRGELVLPPEVLCLRVPLRGMRLVAGLVGSSNSIVGLMSSIA